MKYTKGIGVLGLPEYFKFGVELEADNVKTKGKGSLYTGESAKYIKSKNWHMANALEEALVMEGGAELVSPILRDSEQDWESIADICEHMKKYPGTKGSEVEANSKCGLHVHFDAECLTKDPKRMKNFMRLYAESEELIYKMCNDKNDPIRKYAINRNYHGLINLIGSMWRVGMASPHGKKILEQIEKGTLKVSYKKMGKLKTLAGKYKLDERRYRGLNLTNIGNSKKNTIEFRMANGTLNPEVIKQNVFLYASLIDTAIKMTEDPQSYQERLDEFYQTNVTEQQKAQNFLNLIIESTEDRNIYMKRWESVKDATVFAKNDKKGFAQKRFQREQFKRIAIRTPIDIIKATYAHMKEMIRKTKEKGAAAYDR